MSCAPRKIIDTICSERNGPSFNGAQLMESAGTNNRYTYVSFDWECNVDTNFTNLLSAHYVFLVLLVDDAIGFIIICQYMT